MNNSDLHRPVGLEHVEQPLADRLFLLWSWHLREAAGVEVCELVSGGGDDTPAFHGRSQKATAKDNARVAGKQGRRGAPSLYCAEEPLEISLALYRARNSKNMFHAGGWSLKLTVAATLDREHDAKLHCSQKRNVSMGLGKAQPSTRMLLHQHTPHASLTEGRAWCPCAPTKSRARQARGWCRSRPWS